MKKKVKMKPERGWILVDGSGDIDHPIRIDYTRHQARKRRIETNWLVARIARVEIRELQSSKKAK